MYPMCPKHGFAGVLTWKLWCKSESNSCTLSISSGFTGLQACKNVGFCVTQSAGI